MGEKIATRAAYGDALKKYGKMNPKIVVLDADLAGATYSNRFAMEVPERFFDCGIAECNMVGMAAGMATCGKIPFIHSFAMFAAGRVYDQVRNSVAYPKLNVKIVGTHAGLSVGEDGATHQCIEDIALMRVIPGMTVLNPCDANEADAAVKAVMEFDGPCYLRIGRNPVEVVTDQVKGYKFEIGKGVLLREGSDVAVVATGIMVQEALRAAEILAAEDISVRVIDIHTIKPLDEEMLLKAARECGAIVATEEHNVMAGFGSAVAETVSQAYPVPVIRHGVKDVFGRSGAAQQVLDAYGVNVDGLIQSIRQALSLKNGKFPI